MPTVIHVRRTRAAQRPCEVNSFVFRAMEALHVELLDVKRGCGLDALAVSQYHAMTRSAK